ncbi:hypothetical protein K443DRAFT_56864, partial [Laccaria amethystina LaAM-08-1]
ISSGNSLGGHGNPTELKNMLKNKTMEMASQYCLVLGSPFEILIINVFGMHISFV